jgi:hypothetical protein
LQAAAKRFANQQQTAAYQYTITLIQQIEQAIALV